MEKDCVLDTHQPKPTKDYQEVVTGGIGEALVSTTARMVVVIFTLLLFANSFYGLYKRQIEPDGSLFVDNVSVTEANLHQRIVDQLEPE